MVITHLLSLPSVAQLGKCLSSSSSKTANGNFVHRAQGVLFQTPADISGRSSYRSIDFWCPS